MISSRFDKRIPFYLLAASICSTMVSLFLFQLFLGLLSILWLFEKTANKKEAFDIFTILITGFGVVRILAIIFSLYPASSIQSLYKEALFYFSFFSMSYYLKSLGEEKVKNLAYTLSISSIAVSLIGLVLFNLNLVDRSESFSSGYATFSSFLLVGAGVYIALPFNDKKNINWLLWCAGLSIIFSGIITSLGRTNIAIAFLLFPAGIIFKKIKIKQALVIVFLTALISLLSFHNNNWRLNQRVEHPSSLSDRNIIFMGVDSLKFQHPILGFGPRTFHNIFPFVNLLSDKKVGSWHNDFIQIYFESGIAGLLSFILLIIMTIYFAAVYLNKGGQKIYSRNINIGVLLGTSTLVLSSLTAGFIDSPVLAIVFALLISFLSAIMYYNNSEPGYKPMKN
jgi:O-antigen ligase